MSSLHGTLIGPFSQLLTMANLPLRGAILDSQLEIIEQGGIGVKDGKIIAVGRYQDLKHDFSDIYYIDKPTVAIPGLIDCHTHLVFAGSRAKDYSLRVSGCSYQEIARQGGGILDTVRQTRAASKADLVHLTEQRCKHLQSIGVSTCEVKSGYGLTVEDEIKTLEVIQSLNKLQSIELIPTCLAAHTRPKEFTDNVDYLNYMAENLLPRIYNEGLCKRVDIFIDDTAFNNEEAESYLLKARGLGFSLCMHADQFKSSSGKAIGSKLAAKLKVVSADHLEISTEDDLKALAQSQVAAVALPGASLGLGIPMPPARLMLDKGLCVAIASDWNPGSAPMGNLLVQAAILGAAERLTLAETLAGITVRAAKALGLTDRGDLYIGQRADIALFPCSDYREIFYYQGSLLPFKLYIQGNEVY